jgi:hypothetical protein
MVSQASSQPALLSLPINVDEGFPQAFRLALGNNVYVFTFYVNIAEPLVNSTPEDGFFDLPSPRSFMVLRVEREDAGGRSVIFQRKLVCNFPYVAQELGLYFSRILVAKANLNGVGAFGSAVDGWVTLL